MTFFLTLLGTFVFTTTTALAEPKTAPSHENSFRTIEQPLPVKVGVTLGGIALIGLELWWFLGSKTQARKATSDAAIQQIDITVDGGYAPDRIVVEAGKPVRLNFYRKDPSACVEQVILPDFKRSIELALNETTSVEFTPQKPGAYSFHCGMNMVRGEIEVRSPES
ncbi:cupredoxin domain-containing protein [Baaleninema simplex]|uniref:cupredoxin domain-containing protein n=1 Tax=Baaleninema simplex TaxID=2862350 RepID=UPI00034ADF09|nr:cupredoxin domain-containing protein [Baaleninema simplex]